MSIKRYFFIAALILIMIIIGLFFQKKESDGLDAFLSSYDFSKNNIGYNNTFAFVRDLGNKYVAEEYKILEGEEYNLEITKDEKVILVFQENSSIAYEWDLININDLKDLAISQKHVLSNIYNESFGDGDSNDVRSFEVSAKKTNEYQLMFRYHHIIPEERNVNYNTNLIVNVKVKSN